METVKIGIGILLVVGLIFWWFNRQNKSNAKLVNLHNKFSGILYGYIAAAAIMTAAILYFAEKQWGPRLTVDMNVSVAGSTGTGTSAHAVLQTVISVKNIGRSLQEVPGLQYDLRVLESAIDSKANAFGDLPTVPYSGSNNRIKYRIEPGETEYIYIESSVACSVDFVRILVKLPKPGDPGLNFERKAVIPVGKICKADAPVQTISAMPVAEGAK